MHRELVPHLKVPLPSSSLISRLTVKVNKSLSGVSGAACCDDSNAFFADRRNAVAKLYSILLTCRGEDDTGDALSAQTDNSSSRLHTETLCTNTPAEIMTGRAPKKPPKPLYVSVLEAVVIK